MDQIDLATLAGFFAGEGSITISGGKLPTLYAAVGNTEKVWIDTLHQNFGGVNYLEKPKYSGAKYIFRWRVSGRSAAKFLKAIQPYLKGEKLQQLKVALLFQEIKEAIPNRNKGYANFPGVHLEMGKRREELHNLRRTAAETNRRDAATYSEVIVQSCQ